MFKENRLGVNKLISLHFQVWTRPHVMEGREWRDTGEGRWVEHWVDALHAGVLMLQVYNQHRAYSLLWSISRRAKLDE